MNMNLLALGNLLEDPELRLRVKGACILTNVELTDIVLTEVAKIAASSQDTITDAEIVEVVSTFVAEEEEETEDGDEAV